MNDIKRVDYVRKQELFTECNNKKIPEAEE